MNLHKILLGPCLSSQTLHPTPCRIWKSNTFPRPSAGVCGSVRSLEREGQIDAVAACARYPEQKTAILDCAQECEAECIRITRGNVENWTQIIREQAALTRFQSLALQAGSALTTFADLPDLYSQMGEALTLDREEQDFKPIGELVDNYIRRLDEKTEYVPTGIAVLDRNLHLSPGTCLSSAGGQVPVKPPCHCKSLANKPGRGSVSAISALRQTRTR